MKISEELVKEHGLSEEAVAAIEGFAVSQINEIKKEYDGKANENAQKIIDGAVKQTMETFKIEVDRNQGEKLSEYLTRVSSQVISSKQQEIETLKAEYEEKIKGVKGADNLKAEYEKLQKDLDQVKQKYADYDALKDKADKYESVTEELSGLKLRTAFDSVKPVFPETVNKYEADAKWKAFKDGVLKDYKIELVEGEPIAVSKENEYNTKKLADLLSADKEIQALVEGRQQTGLKGSGANPKDKISIEGVPFKIAKDATPQERTEAIREHLTSKGLDFRSNEYAKQFAELNTKIIQGSKK